MNHPPSWLRTIGLLMMALASLILAGAENSSPVLRRLSFHEDFESGRLEAWLLPHPEDWEILSEGPNQFLHMKRKGEPGVPRRPLQFALLKEAKVGSFDFETKVRREGKSMIVVFNYVDTMHFYYAHLSRDRGTEQPVHNGIFIVDGEPRRRIAGMEAAPALPDNRWHRVRITRDASSGSIEVFVDGQNHPIISVVDRTFLCGQIGIGSFDETGDFDDVTVKSDDASCAPGKPYRPASEI